MFRIAWALELHPDCSSRLHSTTKAIYFPRLQVLNSWMTWCLNDPVSLNQQSNQSKTQHNKLFCQFCLIMCEESSDKAM